MALRNPNTIHLAGEYQLVNTIKGKGTIAPGSQLEYYNDSGELKFRVHSTADAPSQAIIALEKGEQNATIADAYTDGELINAAVAHSGSTWWMYVPSGQNLSPAALLQSDGAGGLKALGDGSPVFVSMEGTGGAITETKYIRVQKFN